MSESARWLEWQDWGDPVLQRLYAIKDSMLEIPDAPGLDLEWDEAGVAAHLWQD